MIDQEELDREADARGKPWKVVFGLSVAFALSALPNSRIQDALRMGAWTSLFLGIVLVYAWPFLIDKISVAVVVAIGLFHGLVMWAAYSRIPEHGYLGIGLVAMGEFVICLIPIAWLDKRSEE